MTSLTAYFIPHSSLRGRNFPRSDTLFGAICWGIRLLFGIEHLEHVLHAFTQRTVPFLLSSMYEYVHTGERTIHYFPKPFTNPYVPPSFVNNPPKTEELIALKRLHAMRTVCDTNFSDILQGKKCDADFYEECLDAVMHAPKAALPASHCVPVPHASINRLTSAHEPDRIFYTEERLFHTRGNGQQSGVFFCVTCRDEFVQDLKAVIYFLADKGIGAGASSGKGHFTSVTLADGVPYCEPPADESTHVVTLSLTYPDDELKQFLSRSWYALERRQGRIESMYMPVDTRKDALLMLREGSTFPRNGQQQYGMNTIVRKAGDGLDFDVWHYGYAFIVNTKHIIPS